MKKKVFFIVVSFLIILILSCAVTAAGAFCPTWLESYEDVYDMNFGFPLKFAEQTTTLVFNSVYFPRYFMPQYFNENFETTLDTGLLIISAVLNVVIVTAIYIVICILYKSYRKKHPKKPKKQKDEYRNVFD